MLLVGLRICASYLDGGLVVFACCLCFRWVASRFLLFGLIIRFGLNVCWCALTRLVGLGVNLFALLISTGYLTALLCLYLSLCCFPVS